MNANSQKKTSTRELLSSIHERLIRIEEVLRANGDRLNLMDLISWDEITISDAEEDTVDTNQYFDDGSSDSDSDESEIVVEESYDSDNDFPRERSEVFPEPPLLLTPLQVELANEEFMQYHDSEHLVDEQVGRMPQLDYMFETNLQMHTDPWADMKN